MRVVLVIPALLSLGAPLADVPALAQLADVGAPPARAGDGIAAALLAAVGLPGDAPPAPFAARGAGLSPAGGDVQYADPVTLVAGRDDVLLAGRVDDLEREEADALVRHLDAHFASDGLEFAAPRPDAWFLASRAVALPATTPLPAVEGAIAAALPRGPHAKPWRRWLSEMQMLLHEHPVNVQREAAGRAPVTGFWPWGGGPVATSAALAGWAVHAAPCHTGDVARGLASAAQSVPARFADLARTSDALVVLPAPTQPDALTALTRDWLDPLAAALRAGTVGAATLVADDGRTAFTWHPRRPTAWQRVRAHFAPPRFTPPGTSA